MVDLKLLYFQAKEITPINRWLQSHKRGGKLIRVLPKKNYQKQTKSHKTVTLPLLACSSLFLCFSTPTKNSSCTLQLHCQRKKHLFSLYLPYGTILPTIIIISMISTIDSRAYPLHHQPNVGSSSPPPRHMSNT